MAYIGELISIGVAFSWTATALLSEFGSKRLGNLTLNVLRMALALLFSLVLFGVVSGSPLPPGRRLRPPDGCSCQDWWGMSPATTACSSAISS